MDRVEVVPGLDPALVVRVVARLRELEPDSIAVLLRGSYVTGAASHDSDLDLTAITNQEFEAPYRAWFESREEGLLPVSVSVKTASHWLAKNNAPADWALGFPATDVAKYVWATAEARKLLGDSPSTRRPPGAPSLEDFVNTAVKVRRATARSDTLGVRLYARETALLAPALLRQLNPERMVSDAREALMAAQTLNAAPQHYRADFDTAAGLVSADEHTIARAVRRLATELLQFLKERAPDVDSQPDMSRYLADGTLERYLTETDN